MDEYSRLEQVAGWYKTQGFYEHLVEYGFNSLSPFFVGTRCLELGPADGSMTRLLMENVEQVTRIEGSITYCRELRKEFSGYPGYEVINSLIEHYDTDSEFDTIVAAHILEHVDDPVDVARRVQNWVSNDGVFIVLVPNSLSFHRLVAVKMGLLETPDQLDEHDLELGHRRVYDLNLLRSHLRNAGWKVVNTGGVFFKPLTNKQIEQWFTEQMIDGFYELGKDFPEHAAEIYAVCQI
jgi:2-polyprenyl-3-methyl-5-hydroxy-6-metoxy-1,4-benzoquinol methylase